jgi:hypothetical protein
VMISQAGLLPAGKFDLYQCRCLSCQQFRTSSLWIHQRVWATPTQTRHRIMITSTMSSQVKGLTRKPHPIPK